MSQPIDAPKAHCSVNGTKVIVETEMERGSFAMVATDGEVIEIPSAVFRALDRCFGKRKLTAKVTIECRNGGCSGVRVEEVLK